MKLLDRIWIFMGLVEADDPDATPVVPAEKSAVRPDRKAERVPKSIEENKPRRNPEPESSQPIPQPSLPVKTLSVSDVAHAGAGGKSQLTITQPVGFDDARQIAENVTNGKTVMVNFERANGETTKRTVDFMSGITYAVGGTVQRISCNVFLFAPASVAVFSSEKFPDEEQAVLPWRRP